MNNRIKVFAPATVANVGPCFDRAGFAVKEPGDVVSVEWNDSSQIEIVEICGDNGKLPLDATKNTAGIVAREILFLADELRGVRIWLEKKMPLFSGLGSSAASGAAAAVAINELLGRPFSKTELLPACRLGEKAACGSDHADNVAPSLFGGLVEILGEKIQQVQLPFNFSVVLISPDFLLATSKSRAAVADLRTALEEDAREKVARLISAQNFNEFTEIISANDLLEKARGGLIPDFFTVKKLGLAAGAAAVTISGSGPSIFAITEDCKKAEKVRCVMEAVFKSKTRSWVTELDMEGARVL